MHKSNPGRIVVSTAIGGLLLWVAILYKGFESKPIVYRVESPHSSPGRHVDIRVNRVSDHIESAVERTLDGGRMTNAVLPPEWFRGIKWSAHNWPARLTIGPAGRTYLRLISGENEADALLHIYLWEGPRLLYTYSTDIKGWKLPAHLDSNDKPVYFDLGSEEAYEQRLFRIPFGKKD